MSEEFQQGDIVDRRCMRAECTEKFSCAADSEVRYCSAHFVPEKKGLSAAEASRPVRRAQPSEGVAVSPHTPPADGKAMRERYVRRCNELRAEGKSDAYIAERLRQEGITGQNGVLPTWKSVYMFFYLKNKKEEKSVQQESKTLNNIENATQCSKIIREHNEKVLATTEPTVLEPLVKASNAPPLVRAILSATELSAEKRIAMLVAYFEPEAE